MEATEGPVLVLAGAGTGKTRVLTTRIAHLLASGRAKPWQILAVTFTNKAAREMKNRVGDLIGGVVEGMQWLGTFHSIGARMLRRHAEMAGLKSDFTILDTDDQIRLMKQIIQAEGIDEKRWPARQLAGYIDHWKNRGLTPNDVPEVDGRAFADGRGRKLYAAYQARLKVLNAADFGDLVLEPLSILRGNADVLADYHNRFRYMLVDEYQDTNVAQYLWLRSAGAGQAPAGRQGAGQHLLRRRRRPVDLWLARGGGRQHPALREGFSRRQGDPAGAQLPLDVAYPGRRLAPDQPQRGAARQDAVHRRSGPGGFARHRRLVMGQ